MLKHREQLAKNPRIGMIYRNWDKQEQSVQEAIIDHANRQIANIENL